MPTIDLSKTQNCPKSSSEKRCSKTITYTYDSMNRRVARTDENGTAQYLYGNPNHPFRLTAVHSPSGNLSCYHYDDFGLLFALERDGNLYYVTTDQLGTPKVVCNENGEVIKVLEYDSFGQLITDSNPKFELHISFAGGLIDTDTELIRFGFRDYDTVAAKWTVKDPIKFSSSDTNLYRYTGNDAMNHIDPSGLDSDSWFVNIIDWGADVLSGGDHHYCGIGNQPWNRNVSQGKCPIPISDQDLACIRHDIALQLSGKKFWQLWNPQVSRIHGTLCSESTHVGMKILFCGMSVVGLPARSLDSFKDWTRENRELLYQMQRDLERIH